jgi:hypothetical protein
MSFLDYHLLEKSAGPARRSSRGYAESLAIWSRLSEIEILASKCGVGKPGLRKTVLAAGPCPGLWRVYYAATLRAESYTPVSTRKYLGIDLPSGLTSKELGLRFESWVRHANRVYNSFLETLEMTALRAIPGSLGRYYQRRAKKLVQIANEQECANTRVRIDPDVSPYPNMIFDLTPDGVFSDGARGAIFESKLSFPGYPEFPYEMALYALGYEKSTRKDVDSALVLHSNYPRRERLLSIVTGILDSSVGNILTNLERFIRLVEYSLLSQDTPKRHSSWKSFLVRPRGLPEVNQRGPCASCRFQPQCYQEGDQN